MPAAYPTAVFIIVPVEDVVTAVLDRPVTPVGREHGFCVGFLGPPARDAIGDFLLVPERLPAALFVQGVPLDHEGLPDVGKVEVAVQFGGDPDLPRLDAPMIRGIIQDKVRLPPVFEEKLDIPMERSLVLLDGEAVVSLAVNEVVGYRTPGEQGISRDVPALDVDSIEERDGCFDLVGALDLLVSYLDAPYFFRV